MYFFVSRHTNRWQLCKIKARRKPSSLPNLASTVTYKKQRNTDEESTKNILAAHREMDQYSEKIMRKMKFCKDDGYIGSK